MKLGRLPEVAHDADENRGRDDRRRPPPAQTRTCGIPASGSYLECLTAKRWSGQG